MHADRRLQLQHLSTSRMWRSPWLWYVAPTHTALASPLCLMSTSLCCTPPSSPTLQPSPTPGLDLACQATVLELLEGLGLPPICVTMALEAQADQRLGEVLALAVKVGAAAACGWVGGRVGCCLGRDVRPWGQLGVGVLPVCNPWTAPPHPVAPRVAHIPPVVGCVWVDIVDVTEVNQHSGGGQLCGRWCMLCMLRSSLCCAVCCVLWLARMNLYPRY